MGRLQLSTVTETTANPTETLRRAQQDVQDAFGTEQPVAQAARHVIRCAMEMVDLLAEQHPDAAHEALSCARAAVGVANYVVRDTVDAARRAT